MPAPTATEAGFFGPTHFATVSSRQSALRPIPARLTFFPSQVCLVSGLRPGPFYIYCWPSQLHAKFLAWLAPCPAAHPHPNVSLRQYSAASSAVPLRASKCIFGNQREPTQHIQRYPRAAGLGGGWPKTQSFFAWARRRWTQHPKRPKGPYGPRWATTLAALQKCGAHLCEAAAAADGVRRKLARLRGGSPPPSQGTEVPRGNGPPGGGGPRPPPSERPAERG